MMECRDCKLWTDPPKDAPCNLSEDKTIRFKLNEFGGFYCDRFKLKECDDASGK